MHFNLKKSLLAAGVLMCSASMATALTVDADYLGNYALEGNINVQSPVYDGWAGAMKFEADVLGEFVGWCLDLGTTARDAKYDVLGKSDPTIFDNGGSAVLLSAGQKEDIQSLFDTAYATVSANLGSKKFSGGFQLALWEIVYEGTHPYSLVDGSFKDTYIDNGNRTAAFDYANEILAGLGADDTSSDVYTLAFLESVRHSSQNLVTAVPLPATGLMLLGGLAFAAGLRRRKKT